MSNGPCRRRATPTCRKEALRCLKALRDAILDRKLTKTRRNFGPKNDEIDAKIEPTSAIEVYGGEANTTHKTKRESEETRQHTTKTRRDGLATHISHDMRCQGEFPTWTPPYLPGESPLAGVNSICSPRDAPRRPETPRDATRRPDETRRDATRRLETPRDASET